MMKKKVLILINVFVLSVITACASINNGSINSNDFVASDIVHLVDDSSAYTPTELTDNSARCLNDNVVLHWRHCKI